MNPRARLHLYKHDENSRDYGQWMTTGWMKCRDAYTETKTSLSGRLQTKDLNTLLGGQYLCIKAFYALCEPSFLGDNLTATLPHVMRSL